MPNDRCRARAASRKKPRKRSGREPFVAMMQAADLWKRHDLSGAARLNRPPLGGILAQRKMRSGSVIIIEVRNKDLSQMGRVRLIELVSKVRGIGAVKPLADAIRPERQIGSA